MAKRPIKKKLPHNVPVYRAAGYNTYLGLNELRVYKRKHPAIGPHPRVHIELDGPASFGPAIARSLALAILNLCNELEK